jgi:hypothetical protein
LEKNQSEEHKTKTKNTKKNPIHTFLCGFFLFGVRFCSSGCFHFQDPGHQVTCERKNRKKKTKQKNKRNKKGQPHIPHTNVYWMCFVFRFFPCCFAFFSFVKIVVLFFFLHFSAWLLFRMSFRVFHVEALEVGLRHFTTISIPTHQPRLQIAAQAMPHQDGARPATPHKVSHKMGLMKP